VTPVPSPVDAFRGIAAFRSVLTPVFDLGALLGNTRAPAPRWLLVEATARVGLAFDSFECHLAVAPTAIARSEQDSASRHVDAIVRLEGRAFPIVDLRSVANIIRNQIPRSLHKEE
jgi:chemotaxis signal transduction protein